MKLRLPILVLGPFLVALACSPAPAEPVASADLVGAARDSVGDVDRGVRFAAAQALGRAADATAIPDLSLLLSDDEWCVRAQAAHSLRRFGEAALPVFARALEHGNPVAMRLAATSTLARMGEPAVATLKKALEDPDERVRYAAVRAFAVDDSASVLRELLAAEDGKIAIEAARMLTELGYGEDAVDTLIAGVREVRGVSRTEVASILKRTGAGGAEEAEALIGILLETKENDYRLRGAIGDVLVAIGEPARPALRAALAEDPETPWQTALGRARSRIDRATEPKTPPEKEVEEPEAEPDPLAELVDPDREPWRRRIAAEVLALESDGRATLRKLLEVESAAPFAYDALLAAEGGVPATEAEARALLSSSAPTARRLGIRAMRNLGRTDAVRPLLEDTDERVRETAMWALAPRKPAARSAPPPLAPVADLVGRLSDPDLAVSLAAARELPRHGSAAAAPLARAMAGGHYGVLHYAEWIFEQLGPDGAEAVPALVPLLGHEDVNVQEIVVRALGDIGPAAAPAVPDLIGMLAVPRISVRGRASVALGRIGEAAVEPLLTARSDPDARVRAGAVHALGWILGARRGEWLVATDLRLPVAEPGPAEETGLVPTEERFARARNLAAAKSTKEAGELLKDLPPEEAVAVLRAGLRLSDVRAAVRCAARLSMENLDAWESERCVELLLPEVFAPDPAASFYRVYEYLGSVEMAATLQYLALADLSDSERTHVQGACHRLVRWDVIPEYDRVLMSEDARVLEDDGGIYFARYLSERYRELEGSLMPVTDDTKEPDPDRLPHLLRRLMEPGPGFPHFATGWLNDEIPGEKDAALLLDLARQAREDPDVWQDLTALLRALGHVTDGESERFLLSFFNDDDDPGHFARSALTRRGDPDALRRLRADAGKDWLPLFLLMEVRPEVGAEVLLRQLLTGSGSAPARDLAEDFANLRWYGTRWPDGLFDGMEEEALAAKPGPCRLAFIALHVPGGRTRRMAAAILAGLPGAGRELFPDPDFDDEEPDPGWPEPGELMAFLFAADPEATVGILRGWSRDDDPALRKGAFRMLASIGDPVSAAALVAFVRNRRVNDPEFDPDSWPLGRTTAPEVEAYLRELAADPELEEYAWRELAVLAGLPERAWPWGPFDESDAAGEAYAALGRDVLAGRAAEGLLAWHRRADPGKVRVEPLGALDLPGARALLRDLTGNRAEVSYPKVLGQLALAGDPAARRELWSGFRAGRYRWICYENDSAALTLGWDPSTYPALLSETESNCCRGGHVARMFEELMGDDALGYLPHGQDATPMRNAREWLRWFGGRWIRSPVETTWFARDSWIRPVR